MIGTATVVPAGAEVVGTVLEADQSGRVKGRASIAFRFDRLSAGSETYVIRTARMRLVALASGAIALVTVPIVPVGAPILIGGLTAVALLLVFDR